MIRQLSHKESNHSEKIFPIILICDGLKSPSNIGGVFRVCDALGIPEIIFCNSQINFNSPRLKKTARNTQHYVSYSENKNTLNAIINLKDNGFKIIALEITDSSESIENLPLFDNQKIALIIGNENEGVSDSILTNSDQSAHIDMNGKNSSMNVVQATSIALYTLINKFYIS
jgi:tRNA G18 (ribose-2'-O)-methylase SpoU